MAVVSCRIWVIPIERGSGKIEEMGCSYGKIMRATGKGYLVQDIVYQYVIREVEAVACRNLSMV